MSYDRQIDQVCPHIVVDELLRLTTNNQVVSPLRPIASQDSVKVRLNGDLNVPPFGVEVPAQSEGTREGPFNITTSTNRMVIRIGEEDPQVLTIPSSAQMPVTRLAYLLNQGLKGLQFYTKGPRLAFRSDLTGKSAKVFIDPNSTLAPIVGIKSRRHYVGRQAAPGWSLVRDTSSLDIRPRRFIVFDEPLLGFTDFAEITYSTIRQECRRCGGLGVENDWRYGVTGEVAQVRDEALLIQELLKLTYTIRGSNPFNQWYGSTLIEQVGRKLSSAGLVQNAIVSDIYATFTRWQSVKRQQESDVGQFVSDEEYPYRLLKVNLEQSDKDPTVLFVTVTVQNRSTKPIQITRGLKLPQPLDLLGSTQAQGVFRESLRNYSLVS